MHPICSKCNSQSRRTEILVAHLRSPCNSTKYYCHDCKKNFYIKKDKLVIKVEDRLVIEFFENHSEFGINYDTDSDETEDEQEVNQEVNPEVCPEICLPNSNT